MNITASMVKELRERTGAGMMDCKKALVAAGGNLEDAIDRMRKSGAAKAAKKMGRTAAEGMASVVFSEDGKTAAVLEVNCETDFAARNQVFVDFVNDLCKLCVAEKPGDVDALLKTTLKNGGTVEKMREAVITKIGENISVRRLQIVESTGILGAYRHGKRIAVVVRMAGGDAVLAKDIAMHIAASSPLCVSEDKIPPKTLERERAIFAEQVKKAGKPDAIAVKIIDGKIKKFINEVTLLGQPFVKNPEVSVADYLREKNATVADFVRFEVGEGIAKKSENFAEEVRAQAKL